MSSFGPKTYAELVVLLKAHFCWRPSVTVQRVFFLTKCDQQTSESITEYVAEIHNHSFTNYFVISWTAYSVIVQVDWSSEIILSYRNSISVVSIYLSMVIYGCQHLKQKI